MFNPNHQPLCEADFFQEETPESNQVRFYRATGNLSEFGLYFSGGLALALLSRLIPGMVVAYALLLLATSGYLALMARGNERESAIIATAIAASVIGGFWDAIKSLFLIINPILLISIPAALICSILLWRFKR